MSSSTASSSAFFAWPAARAAPRGQTTIEYLLVFMLLLVFLQFSVQPALEAGSAAALDVKHVSMARLAASKLAHAINTVAAQPERAVMAVEVSLASDANIGVDSRLFCDQAGGAIVYQVALYSKPPPASALVDAASGPCRAKNPQGNYVCEGRVALAPEALALMDAGACLPAPADPLNGDVFPRATFRVEKNAVNKIVISQLWP